MSSSRFKGLSPQKPRTQKYEPIEQILVITLLNCKTLLASPLLLSFSFSFDKWRDEREISISTIALSPWHLLLLASISLNFVLGISGDSKSSSTEAKAESHTSSSKTDTKVILILLGFGAVAGFTFVLYKLWQKKKRDEQYARLLKLFEEDDELEDS
ncbi:PREDICTED: uncharacterized protein LOC109129472 [Camelina sativa]|uniref:Uncharacterized protein LOC109129472 n=1 Tax=Camelina sativa TaxID=90675 RepID=A0ABM1R2P1_CAMSA|nr:PREDICTED: uncharacterized protein LOC109129472 [Camelina sativa]